MPTYRDLVSRLKSGQDIGSTEYRERGAMDSEEEVEIEEEEEEEYVVVPHTLSLDAELFTAVCALSVSPVASPVVSPAASLSQPSKPSHSSLPSHSSITDSWVNEATFQLDMGDGAM